MPNKMLIDASHPEETRVVVTRGNKVEEFDFESANRRQLRGNIYLAKVTRVEPSLQAAFIEYGGNRHGFLAFSEIHPDYYQIPVADRQALLEADERADREAEEDEERRSRSGGGRRRRGSQRRNRRDGETVSAPAEIPTEFEGETAGSQGHDPDEPAGSDSSVGDTHVEHADAEPGHEPDLRLESSANESPVESVADDDQRHIEDDRAPTEVSASQDDHEPASSDESPEDSEHQDARTDEDEHGSDQGDDDSEEDDEDGEDDELEEHEQVEQVGGADALEDVPERPRVHRRHYKIQEVIKRRQILLVQVVKEERGNKGAALTTYLSLAGRYSGPDAQHRQGRRHLAQDHLGRGPQAPQGYRARTWRCRMAWASSCAPPARPAPSPRSSATSST